MTDVCESKSGTEKTRTKETHIAKPPPSRYGRLRPMRVFVRSLSIPITGLLITSTTLETNSNAPATAGRTPSRLVMKNSNSTDVLFRIVAWLSDPTPKEMRSPNGMPLAGDAAGSLAIRQRIAESMYQLPIISSPSGCPSV